MDIRLPKLGEGAESGTVVSLLVNEGDQIQKGQTLLELENEKAVAPIPAPTAGTIVRLLVKTGDKISVGQTILTLADGAAPVAPVVKDEAPPAEPETYVVEAMTTQEEAEIEATVKPGVTPAASPSIRKIARELGLDLTRVRGSERGGRVVMADLRAYILRLQKFAFQTKAEAKPCVRQPTLESIDFSKWGAVSKVAMSPLRQTISRRMWENWHTIPHVTQFDEADITALNELRKKCAPAYEAAGTRLTLTSFALKAVAATLKKHPAFNSSLDEGAQELVVKQYYHLGVAVDTEQGLIVPVIRDVDKKSMLELSKELGVMAEKARARKVSLDELKGGTFTISNQGGIGGAHFTPIINKPEVAILGLGRGAMKAVVKAGRIEPRLMMPLGLSYDHRVIDGGQAARFIVDLVQAFESFAEAEVKL
jgi:pyruvate dehydrogenase E2 component (dihydrolipoamide acetyltransferase)